MVVASYGLHTASAPEGLPIVAGSHDRNLEVAIATIKLTIATKKLTIVTQSVTIGDANSHDW